MTPARWIPGQALPLILTDPADNPFEANRRSFTVTGEGFLAPVTLKVKAGQGACLVKIKPEFRGELALEVCAAGFSSLTTSIEIAPPCDTLRVAGVQSNRMDWDSTRISILEDDVVIPAGGSLRLGPGTIVLIAPSKNLTIEGGELAAEGDSLSPVIFAQLDESAAWGGIQVNNGSARFDWTIITGGGGDASQPFGHSNSQPVVQAVHSELQGSFLYIFDCVGKAFGTHDSRVELRDCLIQRCDTGGEFVESFLIAERCYWLDIPSDDGLERDDDNDAIYLSGVSAFGDTSRLEDCVFLEGKDDAVDHNGARVILFNCLLDGFDNEGVAASNENFIRVENCLIQNCEQGIEAGYGAPTVEINHCTIRDCETGLRFGDWYYNGCSGVLRVENSISVGNRLHNVWNFDHKSAGPVPGAISIRYSMVNDSAFDGREGCLSGAPDLTKEGTLESGSTGVGGGSDGLNIGRLTLNR